MTGGYQLVTAVGLTAGVALCLCARRWPGRWTRRAALALGALLLAQSLVWQLAPVVSHSWSAADYLPFDLCDMTDLVAVVALWWQPQIAVELLWFWAMAGSVQGILTPNLATGFPHLEFWLYVVEHVGEVSAALLLTIGQRRYPRPGAVPRMLLLSAAYTGLVGVVDAVIPANYMFLAARPFSWSLLTVLGPWPWYVLSATALAGVFFVLLDAPFWAARRRRAAGRRPAGAPRQPTLAGGQSG